MKTRVTVMAVPPTQAINGQPRPGVPAVLLPQPVTEVDGAHGSDEAKKAAVDACSEAGYTVRAVSFVEGGILVYVDQEKAKHRQPRSAKLRRPRR